MIKRKKGMSYMQKKLLRNSGLKNNEKYAFLIKSKKKKFFIIKQKIKCKYNENGC